MANMQLVKPTVKNSQKPSTAGVKKISREEAATNGARLAEQLIVKLRVLANQPQFDDKTLQVAGALWADADRAPADGAWVQRDAPVARAGDPGLQHHAIALRIGGRCAGDSVGNGKAIFRPAQVGLPACRPGGLRSRSIILRRSSPRSASPDSFGRFGCSDGRLRGLCGRSLTRARRECGPERDRPNPGTRLRDC